MIEKKFDRGTVAFRPGVLNRGVPGLLATQPRILIFDEATSALDYESERMIQANMKQIVRGRTVIIIAHRLAAVRNCDRIITIENGSIVEEGTHRELLARPGSVYGRLWRSQAQESND